MNDEELLDKIYTVRHGLQITFLIADSISLIFISAIALYKLTYQFTSWLIWVQIVMLWLSYVAYIVRDITWLQHNFSDLAYSIG